jgi:hypothetical protein
MNTVPTIHALAVDPSNRTSITPERNRIEMTGPASTLALHRHQNQAV